VSFSSALSDFGLGDLAIFSSVTSSLTSGSTPSSSIGSVFLMALVEKASFVCCGGGLAAPAGAPKNLLR
jgi:hypothetical protein